MIRRLAVAPVFLCLLTAQETWKLATDLPPLDMSALTPAQKQATLQLLRAEGCPCGCGMKVAECRVKDPQCSFSRTLAAEAAKEIKNGKSADEVRGLLAKMGPPAPKLLDDPVNIPVLGAPVKGPATAKLTIVEFSDFQCPYCWQAVARAEEILKRHPQEVRLIFKQFPLDIHSEALLAAMASLAANEQGKFWPLHDRMFANYRKVNRDNILLWAKESGMDMPRFTADLDSGKYRGAVEKDVHDGMALGVQGTPTFFINGQKLNATLDVALVESLLAQAAKK